MIVFIQEWNLYAYNFRGAHLSSIKCFSFSLPVPLNVSPEPNKSATDVSAATSHKVETGGYHKSYKLAPAPLIPAPDTKIITDSQNMPAFVQLSGQTGTIKFTVYLYFVGEGQPIKPSRVWLKRYPTKQLIEGNLL